jgi:hypothetical protein
VILARPETVTPVPLRGHYIDVAASGLVAAFARDGRGNLFRPGEPPRALRLPEAWKVESLAISPTGGRISVVVEDGRRLSLLRTPDLQVLARLEGAFCSSAFSRDERVLWAVVRNGPAEAVLEARDGTSIQVIGSAPVADPFRDSYFHPVPHPIDPTRLVVWAAAGQDGQCAYRAAWADRTVRVERLAEMKECTLPAFSRSGDRLVMLCDEGELRHYTFPDGSLLGRMPWPFDEEDSERGDYALFAGDRRALFPTNEHRMHLVDLERMQVIDEVAVAGHEPRPARELYRLDEDGLCTDLEVIVSLGADAFLSSHLDLPTERPIEDWTERFISWRLEST